MSFRASVKSLRRAHTALIEAESSSRSFSCSAVAQLGPPPKIPSRKKTYPGESLNPSEWTEQMRQVREWRSKLEALRAQTANVKRPSYIELAESSSKPAESTTPQAHLLSQLTAATAHLGHIPSSLNSNFTPYIHSKRANLHIIDLEQTIPLLKTACDFVSAVVERDGIILFVGTRTEHKDIVKKAASRLDDNGYAVGGEPWSPGALTNSLTYFGATPVARGASLPDVVVLLNPSENTDLIKECTTCNVPTVGIIDTNVDPRLVTYAIPANMESTRTATLIVNAISLAGLKGREKRLDASMDPSVPRQKKSERRDRGDERR